MATETLNIKVTEDGGSRRTANEFKSMTKEIMRAGEALFNFKKQIRGLGASGLAREMNRATGASRQFSGAARRAKQSVSDLGDAAEKSRGPIRELSSNLAKVRGVLFSLGGIAAARGFLGLSDQFQNMSNRLRLVTDSTEEYRATQQRLFDISKRTRQDIGATVETFVRLRRATESQGVSAERLFGTVTTLNKILALSGRTAGETQSVMLQLSQAFSKGKLDGDEFRSVAENLPEVLTALQTSLGKSQGEIRKMAEAGKLTSDVLLDAFDTVQSEIDLQFSKSTVTLGQAFTNLKGEILKTIGAFNESSGAIGVIVKAIRWLTDNLWLAVAALQAFGIWLGVRAVQAMIKFGQAVQLQVVQSLIAARFHLRGFMAQQASAVLGLNRFAIAAAAAGAAGFELGKMFAQTDVGERFTDRLAGIDDSDRTKTIEESHAIIVKNREAEIDQLKRMRKTQADFAKKLTDERIKEIEMGLRVLENGVKQQIASREAKRAAEELAAAKEAEAHAEALAQMERDKNLRTLNKVVGTFRPTVKAAQDYSDALRELNDAQLNANLSTEEMLAQISELEAHFEDQRKPIDALIRKKKEDLGIARLSGETNRRNAEIDRKNLQELEKAHGKFLTQRDREGKIINKELQAKREELNSLDQQLANRLARLAAGEDPTAKQLKALLASISPVVAAQQKLAESETLLNKAQRRGLITMRERADIFGTLREQSRAALEPRQELLRLSQEEAKTSELGAQALERYNAERAIEQDLISRTGQQLGVLDQILVKFLATQKLASAERQKQISEHDELVASYEGIVAVQREVAKNIRAITDPASTLTPIEQQNAVLEEQLRLYPAVAEEIRAIKDGTAGLTGEALAQAQAQRLLARQFQELSVATDNGVISQEQYIATVERLSEAEARRREAVEASKSSYRGISALLTEEALEAQGVEAITNAFVALEDQIVSLVTTGKFSFKEMIDSMLADVTRLTFRSFIAEGVGAIAAAQHGATLTVGQQNSLRKTLPRFQHGGEFNVGGEGGPDSQLVQFMASPGERVRITAPGQSRMDANAAAQAAAAASQAPTVNITNVLDPSQVSAALASPAGQRAIINTVQMNADLLKKFMR